MVSERKVLGPLLSYLRRVTINVGRSTLALVRYYLPQWKIRVSRYLGR